MDKERYNRQIILEGFGEEGQRKLSAASVLVIGAGGLGCPVLQYLAAAGVGNLAIADDDSISLSNLHRQTLYTTGDIGKLKVSVAAARLKEMNDEVNIIARAMHVDQNNVIDLLDEYDFVFDGTDNFETRYLINDACVLLKKPLIFAAISGYEGQLAVFNIPDQKGITTNYRDLFPVQPRAGEIPNCAENGVLGVVPALIGSMAANEVIKLITGIGKPLINNLLHYNLLTNEQYELYISPGNDYRLPQHANDLLTVDYGDCIAENASYIEIDGEKLNALLNNGSTRCIDVREVFETPKLNHNIFIQMPMSDLDAMLKTEISEKNIILICQHGIRSLAAAEALHDKYGNSKNIYSLKGGIARWQNYFINP